MNLNFEDTVIATLLEYPQHQGKMIIHLKEEYFEKLKNRELFKLLVAFRKKCNFAINMKFFIQNLGYASKDGKTFLKLSDLTEIYDKADSYPMFWEYCKNMKEANSKKKIRSLINDLKKSASNEDLEEIIQLCTEINNERYFVDNAVKFEDSLKINKDKAFSISIGETKPSLLYSGYKYVDFCTQGWALGEFIVISARTGMGKTRFATSLIDSILTTNLNENESIYFFSLEESVEKITNMIIAKNTGINSRRMKSYKLGSALNEYLNADIKRDLFINANRHEADIQTIKNTIEIYKEKGVNNYIIDTLNVVKRELTETEKQALDNRSKILKDIAVQFNVRIFALCQNNRDSEKKDLKGKVSNLPSKSSIKGSDEIGTNADSIISLFKPAYYDRDLIGTPEDCYIANISKTRDGTETDIKFDYDLGVCKFYEKYNSYLDYLIKQDDLSTR